MKQRHLLIDRENVGILTARILCVRCMHTWWVGESELESQLKCRRCGHTATVETDRTKILR